MNHQNGPFLFSQESVFKNISEKIDHEQGQYQFKPPGIVDPYFGGICTVPTLYKGSISHGGGEGYEQ